MFSRPADFLRQHQVSRLVLAFGGQLANPASWRLKDLALWAYFLAICLTQYGNEFIIEFPLNISQLLMMAGCAFLLLDRGNLRIHRIAIPMLSFMGLVTFGLNFNPTLIPNQLKTLFGIVVYFALTFSLIWSHRENLWRFVWIYYRIAMVHAGFAILQVLVWVTTGYTLVEPVLKSQLGGFLNMRPEAFGFLPRAIGFHREPSHLVVFLLPALYFAIQRLFRQEEIQKKFPGWCAWIIVVGFCLTFSLNAYVGLMVILFSATIQKYGKHRMQLVLALAIGSGLVVTAGLTVNSLRVRLAQLASFDPRNLDTNNLSTFAFLSNGLVTVQATIASHGLGFGISSHSQSYDRFLGKFFSAFQVVMRLNSEDAASLYFRLLSEFGILGLIGFVVLVLRSRFRSGGIREQINRMAGIVVLVLAIRNGNYMEPFLWFGVCFLLITNTVKIQSEECCPSTGIVSST